VIVRYVSTDITVETGANGRRLQMTTDFDTSFHNGATANHLAHNNATSHISHVTVRRGNQTVFNADVTPTTAVTIHYR
jgi:hypothetical protein